jgi:hypothetical protein
MTSIRKSSRPCAILFAVCLAGCVTAEDDFEDLGSLEDGKADTVLPRSVDVEIAPGKSKRFRITTATFVASVSQTGDVPAQLVAKHFDFVTESDATRAPRVEAVADGSVRNWTLTVFNRGTTKLAGTLVVDLPRRTGELGIVCDIDKTVMPPETPAGLVPPYPGIAALLSTLELRDAGTPGDLRYVTARKPSGIVGVPEWMAMYGVPAGTIDTGISGIPAVAQREKVADITRIFEARTAQRFVLLGDTSHRDPEVYTEILARFPDRVAAVFIHKVDATVPPARVAGMHLVDNYAEAAAIAYGLRLVTEPEARDIMDAARTEGLAITPAEIDALIDAARP